MGVAGGEGIALRAFYVAIAVAAVQGGSSLLSHGGVPSQLAVMKPCSEMTFGLGS